jgi:hypothetical protein
MMIWVLATAVAVVMFYGVDHAVMGLQGLPLNWDLTPAQ